MVMQKWMKQGAVVLVLLVALTAWFARGRAPASAADQTPEFELVERRSLEVTAEAAGLIEPIRLVEVKSKASGEILSLRVESGDAVKRGDLLGQVDPRDVRNALAQAQADLDVAKARLTMAQAQKSRSVELRAANVITEQEFESSTMEEANARAQYVKAVTNLELAEERMGDVTIRAPIDGVIIRKDVEEGQLIQSASQNISGGTTVFVMADLNEMQVRTLVSETDLGKIQPGMSARVTVEAYPGRVFDGRVTKIEPQAVVEQNVTMFPVLVHLSNQDGALKPGMNAEVVVEVARRENAITIPNAAVVGVREAVAAGALFGLSEDRMRAAMRGGRGDAPQQLAVAAPAEGAAAPASAAATAPANGTSVDGAAQAPQLSAECQALQQQIAAGGFANASEADRARLRECMQTAGAAGGAAASRQGRPGAQPSAQGAQPGQQAPSAQGAPAAAPTAAAPAAQGRPGAGGRGGRAGLGTGDVRPGVVFVYTETGIEPRGVMLGVNDWDHTEVLRGVEPGEHVLLISVARLQQQQQEMLDRMRQRNSGSPFGGGAPAGGRR
jgi:HlyD family secretion protein